MPENSGSSVPDREPNSTQKRVLILSNSALHLINFRMELITALSDLGYAVTVCVPEADRERGPFFIQKGYGFETVSMERRGVNPFHDVRLYRAYRRLIKRIKPTHVITYTIKSNIYGGRAAYRAGIPCTVNVTGLGSAFQNSGMLRRVIVRLYRGGIRHADRIIFENSENRDVMVRERIARPERCVVCAGAGVNLDKFSPVPYPDESNGVNFLYVGRLMREKGIDELFYAVKKLISDGYHIKLHVLGDCEEDYLEQLREGQSKGWLVFHGWVDDVRPYAVDCHCEVLPSYHEGMANVNLENAAMTRPVITTDIHGCKESVIDGESGFLCPPKDAEGLYLAMRRFLDGDAQTHARMGQNGRRHMENVFDKKLVVDQTLRAMGMK